MARWVSGLLLAAALLAATPQPGMAGTKWCLVDPILSIAGYELRLATTFAFRHVDSLTAPVTYVVVVPDDVTVGVRYLPSIVPEEVIVRHDGTTWGGRGPLAVSVTVLVSATRSFPTWTETSGTGVPLFVTHGRSNEPTSITVTFPPAPSTEVGP